jgi:ubiquinone/menaquinone biosynthesis C-methylase UbiE
LLSAKRVGPTGRAFGLDITDEMLALAARNAAAAGATNVEWLKGHIEAIPLPAASVDVVISNCVVNLAADKSAVFREIARVLRPGGRIGITDIVADDALTAEQRAERGSLAGCIAGALSFSEFRSGLEAVGLEDVSLTVTHQVADRMYSVIVKAHRSADASDASTTANAPAAVGAPSCGCGGACA